MTAIRLTTSYEPQTRLSTRPSAASPCGPRSPCNSAPSAAASRDVAKREHRVRQPVCERAVEWPVLHEDAIPECREGELDQKVRVGRGGKAAAVAAALEQLSQDPT